MLTSRTHLQHGELVRVVLSGSGAKKIRLEIGGRDIAGDIDFTSEAGATKTTRSPAGKGFGESLGVSASDLEVLCKDLLKSSPPERIP